MKINPEQQKTAKELSRSFVLTSMDDVSSLDVDYMIYEMIERKTAFLTFIRIRNTHSRLRESCIRFITAVAYGLVYQMLVV